MARWGAVTDVLDHPLDEPDVGPPTEPDDAWTPGTPTVATSTRWPTSRRRRSLSNREWAERIATIVVVAGCVLYTLAQLHPGPPLPPRPHPPPLLAVGGGPRLVRRLPDVRLLHGAAGPGRRGAGRDPAV